MTAFKMSVFVSTVLSQLPPLPPLQAVWSAPKMVRISAPKAVLVRAFPKPLSQGAGRWTDLLLWMPVHIPRLPAQPSPVFFTSSIGEGATTRLSSHPGSWTGVSLREAPTSSHPPFMFPAGTALSHIKEKFKPRIIHELLTCPCQPGRVQSSYAAVALPTRGHFAF